MSDNDPPKPGQEITSNPLFGAIPPTDDTVSSPPPQPLESSQPPPSSPPAQSLEHAEHPLNRPHLPAQAPPPPLPLLPVPRTTTQPHTSLYTYIRRTTYLFSLVLGVSATVALFWSAFLLPRLHSSFSARRVIVEQQLERIKSLVSGLRDVRGRSLYIPTPNRAAEIEGGEIGDPVNGTTSERDSIASQINQDTDDPSSSTAPSPPPKSGLIPEISILSTPLKSLSSALEATSTTRTSVLTSLESYTSQLHREIYLRNPSTGSRMPVGLGTLSSNLSKEGGGSGSSEIVGNARGEEWDAVRKDIRAIKGLLLGRRSFTPT
ncbi:hypothetical protein BCR39DRAFT_559664 [Naematelia encephala]|uniref:Peroxin-14 n=1 Tax=Naematelia encephala TaxID=71784 RepID=A0A1Y2B027_9TREE|nr:hypothetical protein BCR39DRAFT_559664 [Naematelia encephala]